MSQLLASQYFDRERASSRIKNAAWTLALGAVLGCAGALAIAQSAPPALVAELADYIEMPRTASGDGRSVAARINVLIEEPGSARLFVAEHAGPLSIIDKTTRQAVTYINFNGSADAPGLFPRFAPGGGFVSGLMGFAFDPDYRRNGVFYTIHLESPAPTVDARPKAGVLPGLDASRFVATKPIGMPANGQPITREGVLSEWTDTNIRNATFEGTVREVMRVQLLNSIHPMSDLTFNPTARQGDADWRVLYVSTGDGGTGEQADVRRLNPQRLDHFGGAIIRIVPDLREHVSTSQVSENGQYRIPNDNPFVSTPGARKEIFAYGMRNPHRMAWDAPAGARESSEAVGVCYRLQRRIPGSIRDDQHHSSRRQLRLPAARGTGIQAGEPDLWSPERRQYLAVANFRYGRARPANSNAGLGTRIPDGCRGPGDRQRVCLSRQAVASTARRRRLRRHHQRKTVLRKDGGSRRPPRTAIPPRWRRTPRSGRTFPHLCRSASR